MTFAIALLPGLASAQVPPQPMYLPQPLPPLSVIGNPSGASGPAVAVPFTQINSNGANWPSTLANKVWAGPASGTPAQPSFRGLVGADMPINGVGNSNLAQMPATTMKANPTGSAANAQDVTATSFFDAAYCNTIGYLIVRTTGAWTCSKSIAANPVWWGADPTGAADSASAFTSALAASNQIEFPPGKFKFLSAINYTIPAGTNSVTIKGAGQDVTTLTWPGASGGLAINYAGAGSSAHVRDLTFTIGTTAGGTALTLNNPVSLANPGFTATSDIYRITIRGDDGYSVTDYWSNAINIANVSNVQIENLTVFGSASAQGNGVQLIGLPGSATYGVVYNFAKSNFNNLANGIIYGSYIQGVTIDQCNFTSGASPSTGVIAPAAQTGVLDQLTVTNSQFNVRTNAIVFATTVSDVMVSNNLIILPANSNGINFSSAVRYTVTGNVIVAQSVTGTIGVALGPTVTQGTVTANTISSVGTGILLQAGASNSQIANNWIGSGTTTISNVSSAVNNQIFGNGGYNPIGPANISVGASPFTYTAGSSPETIYLLFGTVSQVAIDKNGGALNIAACGASPCTVDLGPNEQVKVTYTAAPSMTKMVH